MLEAFSRIIADILIHKRINHSTGLMIDENLRKSLQMVTQSVLCDSSQTPLWELSSRAFEDVMRAKGL